MRPAVLVVDDESANRRLIGEILRRDEMDVSFADSAEQALRLLELEDVRFDLVLLDRGMPDLDGIEVLRRMKCVPHLAMTPVVMQTGASAPDQVSEGLMAGAHYYLTKPYTPDALRTIVRAALTGARARHELRLQPNTAVGALCLIQRGVFECRTLNEAQALASLLAELAAEPRVAVIGLWELLANAIEHGNLGIDCALKAQLLRQERWLIEVRRRLQLAEHSEKRVRVEIERTGDELALCVSDEGEGFDFEKYLDLDPSRAFEPNGRGIALARLMSFRSLSYEGTGSVAKATLSASVQPLCADPMEDRS